ncbi:hypothetical protein FB45DRAFT_845849 [Roridomyces roridus]|uniref:F-box domain-containing protein n=1 Tax=Roridomyces roridus TaxID=1738132 RepID=A0AAD7B2D9_9AGAR|nr:hypothetical protein FB45DRAFT_845849 [Roridomyces roridus]
MSQAGLSRLKGTNDRPSELEVLQVREIQTEAQKKLDIIEARLDEELEGHSTLEILERNGAALRKTIELCQSILSATRQLPPEILTQIFLFSLPSMEEARRMEWDQSLQKSPWVLCHVCSRWRAVALASPALWTLILVQPVKDDDGDPCSVAMIEAQISRSGNSPLDIIFDYEPWRGDTYAADEAIKLLARCSTRWRSLSITGCYLKELPRIRGRVPLLENLFVGNVGEDEEYGDTPPPNYLDHFQIAPRLRYLEVEACSPYFKVPWGTLTRYVAEGSWAAHISALTQLENLESCRLMISHETDLDDPFTWGNKTVQLARLRRVELSCQRVDSGEYWSWPQWLSLPALTELSINGTMFRGLARLIQDSKCSLKRLYITRGAPDRELTLPVFQSSPHITELVICLIDRFLSTGRANNSIPLISLLTIEPNTPVLLPQLKDLVIVHPGKAEEDIARMLVTRWNTSLENQSIARLRSLRLVEGDPQSHNLIQTLDAMKERGVAVVRSPREYQERNRGDADEAFVIY